MVVVLFRAKKEGLDQYETVLGTQYDVHFVPTLHFNNVGRSNGLVEALNNCQQFSGIIFTSQTAVSVVSELIKEENINVNWPSNVYVVGPATEESDLQVTVGGTAGDATSLSDIIIKNNSSTDCRPLLFPCGNLRKEVLPQRLSDANISLCSLISYETVPHPSLTDYIGAMDWNSVSAVVFFSPSGVHNVLPLLTSHTAVHHFKYCAIGPSTAAALNSFGIQAPLVAVKPTPQDILSVLNSSI